MSLTVPDIECQIGRCENDQTKRTNNGRSAVSWLLVRHSPAYAVRIAASPLDDPNGFA